MSVLLRWASGEASAAMAISIALQVTLVVGVALALDRLLARRAAAAARHAVWLRALLMTLLGPAVVLAMDRAGISLATIRWEPASAAPEGRWEGNAGPAGPRNPATSVLAETLGGKQRTAAQSPDASPAATAQLRPVAAGGPVVGAESGSGDPRRIDRVGPSAVRRGSTLSAVRAILVIWLIGAVMFGVRLIRGMLLLGSLRRSARPIQGGELGSMLEGVRSAVGIGQLPAILVSPRIAGPVALGVLRPAVILPEGLPGSIGAEALRDILIHECAHIVRRDPMVGLVQRVVELIYWPHPMVHLLNHRLSRTREEACDDIVLSRGDAITYARTLLAMADRFATVRRPREALTLMGVKWRLEHRIAGILDPARRIAVRANRGGLHAAGAILLVAGVAAAGVRWEGSRAPSEVPAAQGDAPGEPIPAGRPIRGIVVDEGGKPVAGASVRLVRDWKAAGGAITGADGTFVIRDRSPLMLLEDEMIAVSDEGRLQGKGLFRESLDSRVPSAPARVVLKPSRAVMVLVNDAAGQPVPGASVEVIADCSPVATGRTDDDGRVPLLYPDGSKVELVVALKPGAGFDYFENYRSWPSEGNSTVPASVSLVLNGARTAGLKAVDSSGKPVAGVAFGAWVIKKRGKLAEANISGSRIARARSDRDGIATFDWLPEDAERTVSLLLVPGEYHAPERPIFTPDDQTPVKTVRLVRKVTLRGKVIGPDDRPAPGISVEAAGVGKSFTDDYDRNYARTGADGSYSIAVASDHSYMVAVSDRSWAARSQTGIVLRREGETRDVPDLKLVEGTLLRGRVTVGPDNAPLAGSWIGLTQQGDPLPRDYGSRNGDAERLHRGIETDAEGRYDFRIGPGEYELRGPGPKGTEALTVEAREEIVRDFHLEGLHGVKFHHLRGQVHDLAKGKHTPVADAVLTAFGPSGREIEGRADADGRFDLSVFYDPKFLYARNPEGTRAGFVAIKPGEGLALVHLGPAGRVTGRITDQGGKHLAGWRVWLTIHVEAESGSSTTFNRETVTDDRGNYTFVGLVADTRCEISAPRGPEPWDGNGAISRQEFKLEDPRPITLHDLPVGGP